MKDNGTLEVMYCTNLRIAFNNVAEVLTCKIGLRLVIEKMIRYLHIYGDSTLIINTFIKEKIVRSIQFHTILGKMKELIQKFIDV